MSFRVSDPALDAFDITPDDNNDLLVKPKSIYVANGGDVAVVTSRGVTVTFANMQDGSYLLLSPYRILATGTTATGLVGLV